jgi:hypothetical protein
MAEVQTLLSDLESKREEFERKPAEERAKYEADVQQTRATLAQVRETGGVGGEGGRAKYEAAVRQTHATPAQVGITAHNPGCWSWLSLSWSGSGRQCWCLEGLLW